MRRRTVAKAKKKPAATPAKKPGLAANRRRRRARRNPDGGGGGGARANPPALADFTHVLLPGFAAYGLTRVLQRMIFTVVQKRWPKWGKHAHAAAGVATATAAWFLAHRIKKLAPYHDGVILGSGIAAFQGVAQTYLPAKYNWLLSDCRADDVQRPITIQQQSQQQLPAEGDDEYSYLEDQLDRLERSGSRRARSIPPPKSKSTAVTSALNLATGADDGSVLDPDLMGELDDDEDIDSLYSGAFKN